MVDDEPRARRVGLVDGEYTSSPRRPHADAGQRVTLFAFTVMEPRGAAAASKRREQLVEHIEGLLGARIVGERVVRPGRVRVTVATSRPVSVAAAEDHAREWPGYVRGTFRAGG